MIFSSFTLLSRFAVETSLTLPDLAVLRFGVGALVLSPVFLRHRLAGLHVRQAMALAALGGLGFALLAYSGFSLAPAAHGAVLLHGTLPLFTFLIVMLTKGTGEKPSHPLGVAMIAVGALLMALDSLKGATTRQLLGDASLLAASVCWSAYGIKARAYGLPPLRAAAIVAVLSFLGFAPLYPFMPGGALLSAPVEDVVLQAVFQGLVIGVLSIFVYTRAIAALGASGTALFTAAVPGVTTLGAVPLLGETPSVSALLGVAAATTGMVVAFARRSR